MTVSRFTPSVLPRATLEAVFVAREAVLADVLTRVEDAATSPGRHHTLLVGPRGSGKTHLVALAYHRITDLVAAGARLQVSWLPEDPWAIVSYRHLLAAILRHLDSPLGPVDARGDERTLEARIIAAAEAAGPIVVLLENLDQVLDALDETEQQRLRRLLQSERSLLLVASTTRIDRHLADQAQPFYGFFSATRLEPFTVAQARAMLQALARHARDRDLSAYLDGERAVPRLRAMAHLAGGHPRVWAVVGPALPVRGIDSLAEQLLTRVDDLTPHYQEQVGRLSARMRLVVAELAALGHPLHVAELAQRLGVDQRSLAKSVSELVERGWIAPVRTPVADLVDQRRTYYELADPLAPLVLQIKGDRGEALRPIIGFLTLWFDPEVPAGAQTCPSPTLLGQVDDALRAVSDGDAAPFLRLDGAVRRVLEDGLADPVLRREGIVESRLRVHRLALAAVGREGPEAGGPHPDWVRRAESLVTAGPARESRALLAAWLDHEGRADEADAVRDALAALDGDAAGRRP